MGLSAWLSEVALRLSIFFGLGSFTTWFKRQSVMSEQPTSFFFQCLIRNEQKTNNLTGQVHNNHV